MIILFTKIFWKKTIFPNWYHDDNELFILIILNSVFRLAAETGFLFRPIPKPKPKGVSQFRPNRISAKLAEIRPKAETESVSVVHYKEHSRNFCSLAMAITKNVSKSYSFYIANFKLPYDIYAHVIHSSFFEMLDIGIYIEIY